MNGSQQPPDQQWLSEIREVLYGGPGSKGIIWVVQENSKAIKELRVLLYGAEGKPNGGLVDVIRDNKEFRGRFERIGTWFLGIAGVALLAELGRIVWWAVQQMAQP